MMKKIDFHVHAGLIRRNSENVNPRNPHDNYYADYKELRTHLEAQSIDHAVLMSSGEGICKDFLPVGTNEECRSICTLMPDFFHWMCNVDPISPETVFDRIALYKKQGAVGIGELMINEWLDSPFLMAVFNAAEALEMPVTIHMSPEPGYAYGVCDRPGLPLLEKTLREHPKLKIFGHSQLFWLEISADCPRNGNQARSQMGRGPVVPIGRVEQLFEMFPNLYGDLSAFSGSMAILRDEAHGLAFLEKYADRLLFATDTTNCEQTFPLGAFLDKALADQKLSRDAYKKICRTNAEKILRNCS